MSWIEKIDNTWIKLPYYNSKRGTNDDRPFYFELVPLPCLTSRSKKKKHETSSSELTRQTAKNKNKNKNKIQNKTHGRNASVKLFMMNGKGIQNDKKFKQKGNNNNNNSGSNVDDRLKYPQRYMMICNSFEKSSINGFECNSKTLYFFNKAENVGLWDKACEVFQVSNYINTIEDYRFSDINDMGQDGMESKDDDLEYVTSKMRNINKKDNYYFTTNDKMVFKCKDSIMRRKYLETLIKSPIKHESIMKNATGNDIRYNYIINYNMTVSDQEWLSTEVKLLGNKNDYTKTKNAEEKLEEEDFEQKKGDEMKNDDSDSDNEMISIPIRCKMFSKTISHNVNFILNIEYSDDVTTSVLMSIIKLIIGYSEKQQHRYNSDEEMIEKYQIRLIKGSKRSFVKFLPRKATNTNINNSNTKSFRKKSKRNEEKITQFDKNEISTLGLWLRVERKQQFTYLENQIVTSDAELKNDELKNEMKNEMENDNRLKNCCIDGITYV